MRVRKPSRFRPRQLAAFFCAIAYLFGGMELLPELLALSASLEGSHTLHLARSGARVQIILSHQRERPGTGCPEEILVAASHRHGVASRVFCLFAERTPARPDHVASFGTSSLCERPAAKSQAPAAAAPVLAISARFQPVVILPPDITSLTSFWPLPPPALLGSTVRLI